MQRLSNGTCDAGVELNFDQTLLNRSEPAAETASRVVPHRCLFDQVHFSFPGQEAKTQEAGRGSTLPSCQPAPVSCHWSGSPELPQRCACCRNPLPAKTRTKGGECAAESHTRCARVCADGCRRDGPVGQCSRLCDGRRPRFAQGPEQPQGCGVSCVPPIKDQV